MPVKSDRSLGLTRRTAAVSVLLAMDEHRAQAGQRLRVLRESRGWSQEDLARESGLSTKTVSRFENGKHDGRRATIRQLARALAVEELEILGEPPSPLGLRLTDQVGDGFVEFRDHVANLNARLDQMQAAARRERQSLADEIAQQNELLKRQAKLLGDIERLVRVLEGATVIEEPAAAAEHRELPEPEAGPSTRRVPAREDEPSTGTSGHARQTGQRRPRRSAGQ